jgi:hypothetical protein
MGQVIYPRWPKELKLIKNGEDAPVPYRFISAQRGCRIIVSKYLSSEQMMRLSYEVFLKAREMEVRKNQSPGHSDQGR